MSRTFDYFKLDDKDSRDYGIYLRETGNTRQRPFSLNSDITSSRIVGRDGEYAFDQYYVPDSFTINCFAVSDTTNNDNIRDLEYYVTKLGARKLILSYEPYRYRMVYTQKNSLLEDYGNQGSIFSFDVRAISPFKFSTFTTLDLLAGIYYDDGWYYDSGILYLEDYSDSYQSTNISSGATMTIVNIGTWKARPNIIFEGAATTLLVEQYSDSAMTNKINEFSYGAFNGTLEVNSLLSNTYLDGSITGSIDTTAPYEGYVTLSEMSEKNEIISGEVGSTNTTTVVTLVGHSLSGTNDYYNGKYVTLKYGLDTYIREITDYNGTTKQITLDSGLPTVPNSGWDYSILDLASGANYFKITGTGFSSLDVTFDFRFVYL